MTEDWTSGTLSDLAVANPDKASAIRGLERFRYIDISCLSEDGLAQADSVPVIRAAEAPSRAQRLVKTGDSLIGTVRPERGARGLVGTGLDGEVASSGICVLRPKLAIDAVFVFAVIRDPSFTEWCVNHSTGTSYPAVAPADISRYPLLVPPPSERQRIAEVLGTLDDRIETISRLEDNLLAFGLASLDVHLDRGESASLRVDEIASFENKLRIPLSQQERDKRQGPFPYHGATGIFGYVDDYLFDSFRVLVGEDGSVIDDEGHPVLQLAHGKYWVNNHAHVLKGNKVPTEALWFLMRGLLVDPAVTGAVQPKLSMGRLSALEVQAPELSSPFYEHSIEWISQVLRWRDDMTSLRAARDFLLPRLVSGELRVEAVEEEVEALT